uniref:F-box domain-containing protein n=1 Tax=Tetranychus urticae TaxID=32264 RepID=T1L2S6_TETUR
MLINEIPDDCLLKPVLCVKWSHLIAKRTKKVKYLIGKIQVLLMFHAHCHPFLNLTNLYFRSIAELSPGLHLKVEDAIEFVSKQESLKGLISRYRKPIEKYCDQLEMLSVNHFNPNNLQNSSNIKQLDIWNYSLVDLRRDAHYLPNLERLKVEIDVPDNPYDGPVLEKLKILEMAFRRPCHNIFYGFQFMDSCPNLQSAHILMSANTSFFDETLKHKCLQDLVFQFYGLDNADDTWNYFKRLFKKFPNLKHLALRGHCIITDEHIEQLVHILPNLVLLDAVESADYVKDYLISRGFDFMKHCFRKDWIYVDLSCLLVPIDY